MKKTKRMFMRIMMAGVALGLFGCSFEGNQYSPEQVINNALKETTTLGAYTAESEMTIIEKGQETDRSVMKEWRGEDGKIKIETEGKDGEGKMIVVDDGNTITLYKVEENQAIILGDSEPFSPPSPKEQADQMLKIVQDSHTLSVEGEEKIAGRATYHLVAKANEKDTLIGDMEIWVDKENWMVLKTISSSGDDKVEMVYTKVDFDTKIPAETFALDLPENVEVQNMDDMNETTEVTIEEAAENIGKSILYFPETEERTISKIEMDELQGELARKEINMDYEKDSLPLLTLSFFESPKEVGEEDLKVPGGESVTVRGKEGSAMKTGDFRGLFWQENDVNYSIILIDPNTTFEELIEWTNDMVLVE